MATEVQTEINAAIKAHLSITNAVTFASPHGFLTGQEVVYHSNGAMTVTQDDGTLSLLSNSPTIQISGDAKSSLFGSSPQTTTSTSGSMITGSSAANLTIDSSNDALTLTVNSTPFTITLPHGTYTAAALAGLLEQAINDSPALQAIYDISGLTDGATYYVIKENDDTIQLASSQANANAGTAVTLGSLGFGTGQSFTPTEPASALPFGPSAVATTHPATDEISFASNPKLATGDAVVYQNGGGTSIGGLTDGQTYYVIVVDATHIKLAATFNDAVFNLPVFLTSPGTGTSQSLLVEPTQFDLAGLAVPLPVPISGQIVSVTAAGAGGTERAGAGAVNLNFVRMDSDAHISNNSDVQAAGDVDVESSDTSRIGSGTASVAISLGDSTAINASVGVNDIANQITAYVQGATVQSGGAVNISATEAAQDVNVVVGGAGSGGGNAFGGSFAFNFITNTVDAHIAASGGVGSGGTPSVVTASGPLSVLATDTASIAALAGNIGVTFSGSVAGAAAIAVNNIQETDTATIDDSTASSGGPMLVRATFAKPTELPAGLDVQIAAMAVSGAVTGTGFGAFAGSLSLNWIDNTVEATVSNIAAPQYILAGGELSVLASDASTIDSLAGAIAIVGLGDSAIAAAAGVSVSFNYLGGDPNDPASTKHNVVRAAIENVTGSLKAGQIEVSTSYTGEINNITVAGSVAVGTELASVAVGGAVSINIIHDTSDAHISGSPNITTTVAGADSVDVTATDQSTIRALAGGVGIAVSLGTVGAAAGVSVAENEIDNTIEAYVDSSHVSSAGDVNLTATSMATIAALTIGVAVAAAVGKEGGYAGTGAGAGSGDTVRNSVLAYMNNSVVSSGAGAINVSAGDSPVILTIAGALGVGVAVGAETGAALSIGISAAINDIQDNVQAYINNSVVSATGHNVALTATETASIDAWTLGGAVAVGVGAGAIGIGIGSAGAGSGNTVSNNVYADIGGNSTVTTQNGGDVIVTATDTSSIEAIAGGLGGGVGAGAYVGAGISLGVAAASNNIENSVKAYVDDSAVTSAGMVKLSATENSSILTVTAGGAAAVGVGAFGIVGVGIGVAVAGSTSTSTIKNHVDAYVSGGSKVTALGGGVAIDATDNSSITAGGGAVAAADGVGVGDLFTIGAGLASATGFGVATNDVENSVLAYVDDSIVSATDHSVTLAAVETSTLTAVTVGGSLAIAASGLGPAVAVAVGVGSSSNTVNNTVEAYLADGASVTTTTGGDVTLTATDSPSLTAITVAASLGLSGSLEAVTFTLSAATANNDVEDTVLAYSDSSTITSAGRIALSAIMPTTATIHATSVAASVAGAIGLGAAFAGAGASSTNTVDNTIASDIQGASAGAPSTITAAGDITLTAAENATITSQIATAATAVGLEGGSVGLSLAENTVESGLSAYVDDAKVTSSGGQIAIGASSNDAVTTLSVATSVAAAEGAAGAGARASAVNSPDVEAYAGSGTTLSALGDISITATTTNSATAMTHGIAAGFVALGGSVATATADGSTVAHNDGKVTGCDNLTVQATASDSSAAFAFALAGGIIAGSGAAATATTAPFVSAAINDNSAITSTGSVGVIADQTPDAQAESIGVDVGLFSIGTNVSAATVSGMTSSYVGNSVTISAASLTVEAMRNAMENSEADAGAGGVLAGVNATVSTAHSDGTVQATTGSSVMLPDGDVTIAASSASLQSGTATGVAIGGVFALGTDVANATSNVTTLAQLGAAALTDMSRTGALNVTATGTDENDVSSTAGSGGLIAGDASVGNTQDTSTVSATLGGPLATGVVPVIYAGTVDVAATNNCVFMPDVSSVNAAIAGASAAVASNQGTLAANATVLANTVINATSAVDITAQNTFTEDEPTGGDTVSAGAGGIVNGTAASSTTTLKGNANVTIDGSVMIDVQVPVSQGTSASGIFLIASSVLTTNDQVSLSSGGAVEGSGTNSSLTATLNNNVTTGSTSTAPDAFMTNENMGIGTYSNVDAMNTSEAHTWGVLGALASSSAETDVTSNQTVTLGPDTNLMATQDINLTAGDDPTPGAAAAGMLGDSDAESYASSLVAIPAASATTDLTSNATLIVGTNDQIESGENTTLAADHGTPSAAAKGVGHGKELGVIPLKDGSSTPIVSTSSTVTVNGSITAGIYHTLNITIPNDNTATANGNAIFSDDVIVNGSAPTPVSTAPAVALVSPPMNNPTFVAFTASFDPSFNPNNTIAAAAADGEFSGEEASEDEGFVYDGSVGAMVLGTLFAAGGDVTVNAGTLKGTTGCITAYGGPTITVTNYSPDYLVLDSITIPDEPGGHVVYTGAATAAPAGVHVTPQSSADARPVVNIQELYANPVPPSSGSTNPGPSVFVTATMDTQGNVTLDPSGSVDNEGGQVAITVADGSSIQAGSLSANQVNISAPKGVAAFSNATGLSANAGTPATDWYTTMAWPDGYDPFTDPAMPSDLASVYVAYVANAMFNANGQFGTDPSGIGSVAGDSMYRFGGSGDLGFTEYLVGHLGELPPYSFDEPGGPGEPMTPLILGGVPEDGTSLEFLGATTGDDNSVTASDASSESPVDDSYQFSGSSGYGEMPVVPVEPVGATTADYQTSITGSLTSGSETVTVPSGEAGLVTGEYITGTGISPGTTIQVGSVSFSSFLNIGIDALAVSDTVPLFVGETVTGTGFPSGTTIQAISPPGGGIEAVYLSEAATVTGGENLTATSLTLSAPATVTGTESLTLSQRQRDQRRRGLHQRLVCRRQRADQCGAAQQLVGQPAGIAR